jgi:hypothetical protein
MRYMVLVYSDPQLGERPMEEWMEFHNKYGASSILQSGDRLYGVDTATSVRIRGDNATTTDGPFAETKEQLGGTYVLNCDNIDEVIRFAKDCPGAKTGTLEIRPIFDVPEE